MTMAELARGTRQDFWYALRAIRKDLGLFLFAILLLGIGIGATTSVFSVMSPLMLRPLPFDDPGRLVWVANDGDEAGGMSAVTSRTSNLRDFRASTESFDGLSGFNAFFEQASYNLVGDGTSERLVGVDVVPDLLDVLGVQPALGRNFDEEESVFGGRAAVILTHEFWARRFDEDPALVGSSISLNGVPSEVIGILPDTFDFTSIFAPRARVDFLQPFPVSPETDRWGNTLSMIGRLASGSTVESAQVELDSVVANLAAADPERWGLGARVYGLQEKIARPFRSALLLLVAAAVVVMLIVCVNLSNLLLAKGPKRMREMAIRSALGAARLRLIRQLFFESLLLSLSGGIVGALFAFVVTRLVAGNGAVEIPLLRSASLDGVALAFTLLMAVATGLVVGVGPALQLSSGTESSAMGGSSRGVSVNGRTTRLRDGLVVVEVALACVLLVSGGLLLRSFRNVLDVNLGFEAAELVTWRLSTARSFDSLAETNAFFDQIVANVSSIPGVDSAALTDDIPLGGNRTWDIRAPGFDYDGHESLSAFPHMIDSGFLDTMKIPLLSGRNFTADDSPGSRRVILLNASAAKAVFQGQPVLGRTVFAGGDEAEVIGIVGDVRHQSLEQDAGVEMYFPYSQMWSFSDLEMVVRSSLPAPSLLGSVASAISAVDPAMPTDEFQTFNAVVERSVSPRRFTLFVLSAFSVAALLIAALGIYGVLSYSVAERAAEIGIRMALGETGAGVMRRVLSKTLALASIGVLLGAAGSVLVSRSVSSLLYGVEPGDPMTFVAMAGLLLLVAAIAGFFPALRASRTSAVSVLQSE